MVPEWAWPCVGVGFGRGVGVGSGWAAAHGLAPTHVPRLTRRPPGVSGSRDDFPPGFGPLPLPGRDRPALLSSPRSQSSAGPRRRIPERTWPGPRPGRNRRRRCRNSNPTRIRKQANQIATSHAIRTTTRPFEGVNSHPWNFRLAQLQTPAPESAGFPPEPSCPIRLPIMGRAQSRPEHCRGRAKRRGLQRARRKPAGSVRRPDNVGSRGEATAALSLGPHGRGCRRRTSYPLWFLAGRAGRALIHHRTAGSAGLLIPIASGRREREPCHRACPVRGPDPGGRPR